MSPRMWLRFRLFWTRRKREEGPTEPLESEPAMTTNESMPIARYPAFETYHSKAETVSKMERRRETLGVLPKSLVEKGWEASQAKKEHPQVQSAVESHE
jgi:hypothetical protein